MKKLLIFVFLLSILSSCTSSRYVYPRDIYITDATHIHSSNDAFSVLFKTYESYLFFLEEVVTPKNIEPFDETFFNDNYLVFIYFIMGIDIGLSVYTVEDLRLDNNQLHVTVSYTYNPLIERNFVRDPISIMIRIKQLNIENVTYELNFIEPKNI